MRGAGRRPSKVLRPGGVKQEKARKKELKAAKKTKERERKDKKQEKEDNNKMVREKGAAILRGFLERHLLKITQVHLLNALKHKDDIITSFILTCEESHYL
jgi:hypothetical protein